MKIFTLEIFRLYGKYKDLTQIANILVCMHAVITVEYMCIELKMVFALGAQ